MVWKAFEYFHAVVCWELYNLTVLFYISQYHMLLVYVLIQTSTPNVADPVCVMYGDISTIKENIHILLFNVANISTFNKYIDLLKYLLNIDLLVSKNARRAFCFQHTVLVSSYCIITLQGSSFFEHSHMYVWIGIHGH